MLQDLNLKKNLTKMENTEDIKVEVANQEPEPEEEEDIIAKYSLKYKTWRELDRFLTKRLEGIKKEREHIDRLIDILEGNKKISPEEEIKEDIDRIISDCSKFVDNFGHLEVDKSVKPFTYLPPQFAERIISNLEGVKANINNYKSKSDGLIMAYRSCYKLIKEIDTYIIQNLNNLCREAHKEYLSEEQIKLLEHETKTEIKVAKSYLSSLSPEDIDRLEDEELKQILLNLFEKRNQQLITELEALRTQVDSLEEEKTSLLEKINELKAEVQTVKRTYIKPEKFQEELEKAAKYYPDLVMPEIGSREYAEEMVFFIHLYSTKLSITGGMKILPSVLQTIISLVYMGKYKVFNKHLDEGMRASNGMIRKDKMKGKDCYALNPMKNDEIVEVVSKLKHGKFRFLTKRGEV